jgi:hypothetical protein
VGSVKSSPGSVSGHCAAIQAGPRAHLAGCLRTDVNFILQAIRLAAGCYEEPEASRKTGPLKYWNLNPSTERVFLGCQACYSGLGISRYP